jgi:hypothetical protein
VVRCATALPCRDGAQLLTRSPPCTVRKAAVGTGGALLMRFRCEPSLPVDVIGLFVLLPAPQL